MNKIETILSEARKNTKYESAYSVETQCEIHMRLFDENSCFLVSDDYHGLYHDDYAEFIYYSNITGEYFKDNWTTATCCPNYDSYKSCKTFKEAEKLGLIDIKIWNDNLAWLPKEITIGEFWTKNPIDYAKFIGINPIVKVYRGRTNKNRKGYYISKRTVQGFTGPEDKAVIYDLDTNEFFMVNENYIKLDEDYVSEVNKLWVEYVENEKTITNRLAKFTKEIRQKLLIDKFFGGNYADWYNKKSNEEYKWWLKYQEEEKKKKFNPSEKLLQWTRDHFKHVTDENEIRQIAIKIMMKNNAI